MSEKIFKNTISAENRPEKSSKDSTLKISAEFQKNKVEMNFYSGLLYISILWFLSVKICQKLNQLKIFNLTHLSFGFSIGPLLKFLTRAISQNCLIKIKILYSWNQSML